MSLALVSDGKQAATIKPNCQSLSESAANHFQSGCRITKVNKQLYFHMKDVPQVKIKLRPASK